MVKNKDIVRTLLWRHIKLFFCPSKSAQSFSLLFFSANGQGWYPPSPPKIQNPKIQNPLALFNPICRTLHIRAHNLCHDNRQLIVIAINRNHSAIKISCN